MISSRTNNKSAPGGATDLFNFFVDDPPDIIHYSRLTVVTRTTLHVSSFRNLNYNFS